MLFLLILCIFLHNDIIVYLTNNLADVLQFIFDSFLIFIHY